MSKPCPLNNYLADGGTVICVKTKDGSPIMVYPGTFLHKVLFTQPQTIEEKKEVHSCTKQT